MNDEFTIKVIGNLKYEGRRNISMSFTSLDGNKISRELSPNDCVFFQSPNLVVIEKENGDREEIEMMKNDMELH